MEEIDIFASLQQENLFELFKSQLKKDFEGAGANADFTAQLPAGFDALKAALVEVLNPLAQQATALPSLLYRVDISEQQLHKYQQAHPQLSFEEMIAELIIKRVLQKVILRKTFSK